MAEGTWRQWLARKVVERLVAVDSSRHLDLLEPDLGMKRLIIGASPAPASSTSQI